LTKPFERRGRRSFAEDPDFLPAFDLEAVTINLLLDNRGVFTRSWGLD